MKKTGFDLYSCILLCKKVPTFGSLEGFELLRWNPFDLQGAGLRAAKAAAERAALGRELLPTPLLGQRKQSLFLIAMASNLLAMAWEMSVDVYRPIIRVFMMFMSCVSSASGRATPHAAYKYTIYVRDES